MQMRLIARLAALILLSQLGGCTSIASRWPFGKQLPPAPPASNRAHREFPPTTITETPTKEEKEAGAIRKQPATAGIPAQTAPTPAQATNVTLEDNDADHLRAQSLLDDADARLAHVDRSKLSGENATAYDQASNLANAARKAMVQQDYLAASGLARKAALLTEQLASRAPPTRTPSR
jgi:hypothetical protein